jgi:type IV secretion system protein VirB10
MTTENMSPDSSPDSVRPSGVRRVNNLPLIIAGLALIVFVGMIAFVAVKRSNNSKVTETDVTTNAKKNISTNMMAQEVLGDHVSGFVPPTPPKKNDPPAPALNVPVAPTANLDSPPQPPRLNAENRGGGTSDPDEERIHQAKIRALEEAIQSKTSISLPNQLNANAGVTSSSPKTRQEMINRLADVQRQIGASTSGDPNAGYQARLQQIQSSLNGGGNSFGENSGPQLLGTTQQSNNELQSYDKTNQSDRWALNESVQAPKSQFEFRAGGVIPGVMISGINSDLPGQIMGQVSQDVYDTATGKYLLIPQGTRLIGTYSANVVYGQTGVFIAWQRLVFPDGKALDIGSMPGADGAGYAGFRDQVNNHYLRIFGSAFLMSGITAGVAYSQDKYTNNDSDKPTMSSEMAQSLGQQFGQVAARMIEKNLNIAPTLEIRPGYRFNIIAIKDLTFTGPYSGFDYKS